jgi:hypothetical protein
MVTVMVNVKVIGHVDSGSVASLGSHSNAASFISTTTCGVMSGSSRGLSASDRSFRLTPIRRRFSF